MIAVRSGLTFAARQAAEQTIQARLIELLATRPPGALAFCPAIRGECDIAPAALSLQQRGWQLAMPVVERRQAPMVFRPWWPDMPMRVDPHGLPVPDTTLIIHPDVVLVPLVAFDAACHRLGYGGGYFDRTLSVLAPRPWMIGVAFALQRVASIAPQAHDRPLDRVITEKDDCNCAADAR